MVIAKFLITFLSDTLFFLFKEIWNEIKNSMTRLFSKRGQISEEEKSEPLKEKSIINYEKISKSQVEKHVLLKRRSSEFLNEDPQVFHSYKKRIIGKRSPVLFFSSKMMVFFYIYLLTLFY